MEASVPGVAPASSERFHPSPTEEESAISVPAAGGEKELEQPRDPWWEVGIYIGTSQVNFGTHFVFLSSFYNEQRRRLRDGEHSTVFATPSLRHDNPRFFVGVPYWFRTRLDCLGTAPDGATIYEISGSAHDVNLFHPSAEHPPPVIRCSFLGTNDKFLFCKATETHQLRLDREPVFSIFKDQQVVTSGGDFLVKLRSVESGSAVFPHAVQPGGISATLSRDLVISTPEVDSPPKAFISGVCDVKKYYLVIGCPDQPAIPTITTLDLLLEGGLESISEKNQLIDLFVRILTSKYLAQSDNPLPVENSERATACRRAKYIVENHCIHHDFSTLLWHEGLLSRDGSRSICSLLQGESFNPSLIAICSGPTVFTSDEDFFDVNPALFPVNLFEQVSIIKGCVNVSNRRPSGKLCHLGSGNTVKFAIGRVARVVANPWDLPCMFPALAVIVVIGVSPQRAYL